MIEIRGNCSEQGHKKISVELGDGLRSRGIETNERWIRDEIWNMEPKAETVERLIEWFSSERNERTR